MGKPEQRGESKDKSQDSKTKPAQGSNAKQSAQSPSKASGQPRYDDRPEAVKPGKGQTSLPRYDDQPKKTRTNEKSGGADVPDYGDQESGDPRSTEIFD